MCRWSWTPRDLELHCVGCSILACIVFAGDVSQTEAGVRAFGAMLGCLVVLVFGHHR